MYKGDNIKIVLKVVRWGFIDWIDLVQDWDSWRQPINAVMKTRV
jgi:hypothetical protein